MADEHAQLHGCRSPLLDDIWLLCGKKKQMDYPFKKRNVGTPKEKIDALVFIHARRPTNMVGVRSAAIGQRFADPA